MKNLGDRTVTYAVEDPKVATVDEKGVVTGVAKGGTNLIATVGGITYPVKITVK